MMTALQNWIAQASHLLVDSSQFGYREKMYVHVAAVWIQMRLPLTHDGDDDGDGDDDDGDDVDDAVGMARTYLQCWALLASTKRSWQLCVTCTNSTKTTRSACTSTWRRL
jgi:hypothetical protein